MCLEITLKDKSDISLGQIKAKTTLTLITGSRYVFLNRYTG